MRFGFRAGFIAMSSAIAMTCVGLGIGLRADDLAKDTSLSIAPKDSAFYVTSLRQREQLERFWNSEFVGEIRKIPFINGWYEKGKSEWESGEGQAAQAKAILENPSVQRVVDFVIDAGSKEAFLIGDKNWVTFSSKYAVILDEFAKLQLESEDPKEMLSYLLEFPKDRVDALPIPGTVAGFRLSDAERGREILDQLQGLIFAAGQAEQVKPFMKGLKRTDKGDDSLLTLTLSGSQIPWDEFPTQGEEQEKVIAKVKELLEGRKIAITIGVKGEFFVVAFSEDPSFITNLGKGPSLLEHPQLADLKSKTPDNLTAIGFVSDELADANWQVSLNNYFQRTGASMVSALKTGLAAESEIREAVEEAEEEIKEAEEEEEEDEDGDDKDDESDEEEEEEQDDDDGDKQSVELIKSVLASLPSDLKWLDDEIRKFVPKQKGTLAYSYLTEAGVEAIAINRTKAVFLDGAKPLELLQHLGSKPLAFVVWREQFHPEYYELVSKIAGKVKGYVETIAKSGTLEEEQSAQVNLVLEEVWPLLEEYSATFRNKIYPSNKAGEGSIVISRHLENEQWLKDAPVSDEPLPLPEVAIVSSVSDRESLVDGLKDALTTTDKLVNLLKKLQVEGIPSEYTIPRPESEEVKGATKYFYSIPEDCPVPKDLLPQLIIDKHLSIASYSSAQVSELLPEKNLGVGGKVIDQSKKLAGASYVNFAELVDITKPWFRYALKQENDLDDVVVPEQDGVPALKYSDLLSIYSAFGKLGEARSVTTIENGESVTRTQWLVK